MSAMATTPLLSVRDLTVEFPTRRGTLRAVDGVSFDVAAGEVLGIVGESGAGKSLTGAAIIRLLEPPGRIAAGAVGLQGERIDQLSAAAFRHIRGARIGMVFQDPLSSLNPLYTIGRQIIETIETHLAVSAAQARRRAVALLSEVGIPAAEQRLDAYPHEFSGGMRQRVVIALALAAEPELVIADEPTTALDVSVQAQVIAVLKRLTRDRGTAVILITHDMGVIAETADRVAVMYAGQVVEYCGVREAFRRSLHPYTAGLQASLPKLGVRQDTLRTIPGTVPNPARFPEGCRFHPRCPVALPRCLETPQLLEFAPGHLSRCFRADEIARGELDPVPAQGAR